MSPSEPTAAPALTFILPTRNRREWVGRAIESCLQADHAECRVEVLVVDGNSTDGSFEQLQERYGADARVRMVRQEGAKGFMAGCFFAVPLVRTPLATFMYDDDVLSPFWSDLPRELLRRKAAFAMGFGAHCDVAQTYSFTRVKVLRVVTPSFLLRAYCGCGRELSSNGMPLSPICCVTEAARLREWMVETQRFTRGHALREHFMMERNAGPDLMIYLYSIAMHPGEIPVFDGPVAQHSVQAGSFTSALEPADLVLGYWTAEIWLCEHLLRTGQYSDAGWCAAYAVRRGIRFLFRRLLRGKSAWCGSIFQETAALVARVLASGGAAAFVKSFFILLLPRGWRPHFGLLTRSEELLG